MEKSGKATRSQYRTKISEKFSEKIKFGDLAFKKTISMRYGENPGYPAAFYAEEGAKGPNMSTMKILKEGTKGLSYINVGDMDLGQRLIVKLSQIFPENNICVLIKHEMPSGIAMGKESHKTFDKAWKCDPLSNFGSVDVFNFSVDEKTSRLITEKGRNVEVVYAPDFSSSAMDILVQRKPLRIVKMGASCQVPSQDMPVEFKRVAGGFLLQERFNSRIVSPESVDIVSKKNPTHEEVQAAVFAWNVACFTRSNAIVIGTKDKIHGIGSGQRSRIDAAEDAIRLSKRGYGARGCVMASDAFMPFTDVVELASKHGIKAIICPLGSVRDQDVIDMADDCGIAMIVTRKPGETDSERCFLHR